MGTEVEMGRVVVIRPNLVQSHVKVGLAKKAKLQVSQRSIHPQRLQFEVKEVKKMVLWTD